MILSKCRWFNDHQAPCCLMIDDLVPAAVSLDGKLGPHNDWGYLMDGPDSLFSYFKCNLLEKYPEIRGTIFMPLESQRDIAEEKGYSVFRRDIDLNFVEFTKRFSNNFELAFHGIRHTYLNDGQLIYEFENVSEEDLILLKKKNESFAAIGIVFKGGKFPGYKYCQNAIHFAKLVNFKWLALSANMINKKHPNNELSFIINSDIVDIPTNLSGNIFSNKLDHAGCLKRTIKYFIFPAKRLKPEEYLEYLYLNGFPITIQEHFQNQRTDGRRQTPNVYDDIRSLDRIFDFIRNRDIWNATCSEIALYFNSYTNTIIRERNNDEFEILYRGNWDNAFLTIASDIPRLEEIASGDKFHGIPKNGRFVFNHMYEGIYRPCQ
ncbi:MAG: hypothetical protein JW925_10870 [Syntrophaceae bacterium]|nr:hypothetical protein [Syntrophaceae bacterium]